VRFLDALLQGSPDVLSLLDANPFPDGPPRFVRAMAYDYRFTDAETLRRQGTWWRREPLGPYCPVLTREGGQLAVWRPAPDGLTPPDERDSRPATHP
jgi:hypothetical protein